ncbi:MAG: putative dehydrogenase [Verrucomicrobiaceae bacterium]|nr:putative dehydrogenase [Verrucomicrobiaceae bacterium]
MRVGMIGVDTSHAQEFAARLNDPANPSYVPGARIVAAFPVASTDLPGSAERVDGFTNTMRDKYGVRIVSSIDELSKTVDAVMILSLDGRAHLEQVKAVLPCKKPIFLDKPVAASLKDAVEIFQLAEAAGTPLFSASALRWYPGVQEVASAKIASPSGAISSGPAPIQAFHPDLFFYGVHPTEALFTVLGGGCVSVVCTTGAGASVITGQWSDGRVGTLYAMHNWPAPYKVTLYGKDQVVEQHSEGGDYTPLVREIVKFFQSGKPPVNAAKTLEIYAFMEAADESKRRKGAPVLLRDMLVQAGCPEKWQCPSKVKIAASAQASALKPVPGGTAKP